MRIWECPKCTSTTATKSTEARTPMHPCRGMAGLVVPMVAAGTKAKLVANEREDYIGKEHVQYDANGRPMMNAVVTRDDGTDSAVYAPVAVMGADNAG